MMFCGVIWKPNTISNCDCGNLSDVFALYRGNYTYFCQKCYSKIIKTSNILAVCTACFGHALENSSWLCGLHYDKWVVEYGTNKKSKNI